MRVSYQIDDRFFTGDTTKLMKRCEAARTVIQTQLTDISPKLGRREMSFACKAEHDDFIEMNIQISFPGASAFAQVRWRRPEPAGRLKMYSLSPKIPAVQGIIDAFMKKSENGQNVPFHQSRLGAAIIWALDNGLPNITKQYEDALQFDSFDLKSISKVSA